jgi:AcrR family transcriptional regulator
MSPVMPKDYFDFRKNQILKSAWECFEEKGYQKFTIRDIAKKIGVSPGAIYNYFKGKDEIIEELHKWNLLEKKKLFDQAAHKGSARESLGEFFTNIFQSIPEQELIKFHRGDINLWSEALRQKNLRKIFNENQEDSLNNLVVLIQKGIESQEINARLNPKALAGYFLALWKGLQLQLVLTDDLDVNVYLEEIKEIMLGNTWRERQSS